MKAITSAVAPVPLDLLKSGNGLSALRASDIEQIGMTIRLPHEYGKALKNLPSGRALRRLMARQCK